MRLAYRDIFRETELPERIIPGIEETLAASAMEQPNAPEDATEPAIPNPETVGDAGHGA